MKQITIYDLLPMLKPGYVAMDYVGVWWWYEKKPHVDHWYSTWKSEDGDYCECTDLIEFNIKEFDGDWKDSLIEVNNDR